MKGCGGRAKVFSGGTEERETTTRFLITPRNPRCISSPTKLQLTTETYISLSPHNGFHLLAHVLHPHSQAHCGVDSVAVLPPSLGIDDQPVRVCVGLGGGGHCELGPC